MATEVQTTGKSVQNNTPTGVLSFASLPAIGSTLLLFVIGWCNPVHPFVEADVSDNQGNDWELVVARNNGFGTGAIYRCEVTVSSGTFTISVATGANVYYVLCATEYSGRLETNQIASAVGTSTAPNAGSITTTEDDELLFSLAVINASVLTTWAAAGDWTGIIEEENAAVHASGAVARKAAPTIGAYSHAWTLGVSRPWAAMIASFATAEAASSVAPKVAHYMRLRR